MLDKPWLWPWSHSNAFRALPRPPKYLSRTQVKAAMSMHSPTWPAFGLGLAGFGFGGESIFHFPLWAQARAFSCGAPPFRLLARTHANWQTTTPLFSYVIKTQNRRQAWTQKNNSSCRYKLHLQQPATSARALRKRVNSSAIGQLQNQFAEKVGQTI